MFGSSKTQLVLASAVLFSTSACTNSDNADAVAGRFVDAYYIEFDFGRAASLAEGAALRRIEREAALVEAARAKTAIQDAKARVYYDAPTKHVVADDMVHFRYVLDIRRGPNKIVQPSTIMVARRKGAWKIIQFREDGAPLRPEPGHAPKGTATSSRTASP